MLVDLAEPAADLLDASGLIARPEDALALGQIWADELGVAEFPLAQADAIADQLDRVQRA
jgi:hypothetical protein